MQERRCPEHRGGCVLACAGGARLRAPGQTLTVGGVGLVRAPAHRCRRSRDRCLTEALRHALAVLSASQRLSWSTNSAAVAGRPTWWQYSTTCGALGPRQQLLPIVCVRVRSVNSDVARFECGRQRGKDAYLEVAPCHPKPGWGLHEDRPLPLFRGKVQVNADRKQITGSILIRKHDIEHAEDRGVLRRAVQTERAGQAKQRAAVTR